MLADPCKTAVFMLTVIGMFETLDYILTNTEEDEIEKGSA